MPLAWAAYLVVCLLSIWALPSLKFDYDFESAFVGPSKWYVDYSEHSEHFHTAERQVAVLFEGDALSNPSNLAAVRDFVLEAQFVNGIAEVQSAFAIRRPEGWPEAGGPIIPADIHSTEGLQALLRQAHSDIPIFAMFMNDAAGTTVVVVDFGASVPEPALLRQIIGELDRLGTVVTDATGLRMTITGGPILNLEVLDILASETLLLNAAGGTLAALLSIVAMRSVRLGLLVTVPSATALLWVLGGFSVLGININILSIVVPFLILALSFADCLHLTFENLRLTRQQSTTGSVALLSLRRVGPACALASITTAAAFAGLLLSDAQMVRTLAVAGLVGTMLALAAVLFVHPLLFMTIERTIGLSRLSPRTKPGAPFGLNAAWLPRIAVRYPRSVTVASLAILAVTATVYTQIETRFQFTESVNPKSDTLRAMNRIEAALLPLLSIDLPVALSSSGQSTGDIDRIVQAHQLFSERVPGAAVISAADLAVGGTPEQIAQALAQLPEGQRGQFISTQGDFALVRARLPDLGAKETRTLVGDIGAAIEDRGLDWIGAPTGLLVTAAFMTPKLIGDINVSLLLAVLFSGALILVWFRRWRFGLSALLPNLLPIMLLGAWLHLSGNGLQFWSGTALTIAFGIAVDDTVHVLNRVRLNGGILNANPAIIRRSTAEAAPALILTTVVLAVGLIPALGSSIPTVGSFALASIAIFVLALLADLFVLPAALIVAHQHAGSTS